MRRVGQARKRDANEKAIVDALRKVGAQVIRISERGAPDLLVLFHGKVTLMECKSPNGRATWAQDVTSQQGWPVRVVRDHGEALAAINAYYLHEALTENAR